MEFRGKLIPRSRFVIHGILALLSIILVVTHFWIWLVIQVLFFALCITIIVNSGDSISDSKAVVISNIFGHSIFMLVIFGVMSLIHLDDAGEVLDDLIKGFEDASNDPNDCDHTRTEKTWDGYLKCKSCGETLD